MSIVIMDVIAIVDAIVVVMAKVKLVTVNVALIQIIIARIAENYWVQETLV